MRHAGPGLEDAVDTVLAADLKRREVETQLQNLQAERNRLSKQIGAMRSKGHDTASIEAEVKSRAAAMQALSQQGALLDREQRDLLLNLPNLPLGTVPIGPDSSHNPVVRTWGERTDSGRTEDHVSIVARLDLIDFDRASKMSERRIRMFQG